MGKAHQALDYPSFTAFLAAELALFWRLPEIRELVAALDPPSCAANR